ncbi:MAG: hypothetical protein K6B13_00795, partial [Prevotella sp.]|nr:hypothetical protein [Prevotella sp.]
PPMGEGFPPMGAFPPMDSMPPMGEGFPQMGAFPFDAVGMFAAYRVSSYEEEIKMLKQWLADRLAFLDSQIARFDSDWQPRIQPLVEKKRQFPFGAFPFGR